MLILHVCILASYSRPLTHTVNLEYTTLSPTVKAEKMSWLHWVLIIIIY